MSQSKESSNSGAVVKHSFIYAVGNIARQLAGFLMLPIYTRYLSPEDYGVVGLLAFALAVLEPVLGARLTQALPQFYFSAHDERSKSAVMSSAIILMTVVSALSAGLIFVYQEPVSNLLFGTTEYALAAALFGLNILAQPVEYSGMTFIRMQEKSLLFLYVSLAKLVAQIAINIWLVIYLDMGVLGVILSGVISSVLIGIGLTIYIYSYNTFRLDMEITWKMLVFCWPLWFAGLAGLYINSSNRLYLRIFSNLSDIGLIELGTKFASIIGLIWSPFLQQWEISSYKIYEQHDAKKIFQNAFIGISAMLAIAGLGVSLFSEFLIIMMSGEAFHAATKTVPYLTAAYILNSLASFFNFSFMITNNTKKLSYCYFATAAIITGLYIALIPKLGAEGAAMGLCIAYAISYFITFYYSQKYYDLGVNLTTSNTLLITSIAGYALYSALKLDQLMSNFLLASAIFIVFSSLMLMTTYRATGLDKAKIYATIRSVSPFRP